MGDRIVDISEGAANLRVENRQLIVERKEQPPRSMPMDEIGVLVLGTSWLTMTQPVLSTLSECGGVAVICDNRCLPVSLLLPLYANTLHSQRLRQQVSASLPTTKRLWAQVVETKILSQAAVLQELRGDDCGLAVLATTVKSGDTSNVEGQAARRYWQALFDDPDFRRQPQEGEPPNNLLNYGYAILRAMVARAIVASGLTVAYGIHHCNRENPFCLADDLMEPFRPLIDRQVVKMVTLYGKGMELDKDAKAHLLRPLLGRLEMAGEWRTVFDVFGRMSASLAMIFAGETSRLELPADCTALRLS